MKITHGIASLGRGLALAGLMLTAGGAQAQEPPDFYRNKTIQLIVPFSPGGIYDLTSRILIRYMPEFIPGRPQMVVQNQPGGGGITGANRLASAVEKDGLTIAAISRGIPQLAMVGDPNVTFDPLKLTWLGSLSSYDNDGYLLTINASNAAKSIEDMRKGKSVHLAGVGVGATNTTFALIARDLLGMNIAEVRGFPGANDIWLAMERGEIDGQVIDLSAIMSARPNLWRDGQLRVLVQFARKTRLPGLPDVPVARELVTNPADRALLEFAESPFFMALPFAAPPNIPADRAKILKDAFMKASADAAFKAEMEKSGFLISPIDGDAVAAVITEAAKTPADVKARMGKLILPN
jgi:tripartite-type tricarboxylate transporter receptor subunit TctC